MGYKEFIVQNRFKDKVCIVTGGGSGIGRETALRLANEGARIVVSDINIEMGKESSQLINAIGGQAIAVKTDICSTDSITYMVEKTVSEFKRIDILINSAGIVVRGGLFSSKEDEWNKEIDVDLTGTARAIKYVAQQMRKTGGGKIVNIASAAGNIGSGAAIYSAAKGGVIALTKVLAGEFAPYKINVNAICPGFTATPLNETVREMGLEEVVEKKIPWGRWATAKDISSVIAFLASEEADYMTGAVVSVDGGFTSFIDLGPEYRQFDTMKGL
ncbi:MAG: glucose 1-dehydrogenase [Syntrophaceae bacterium]|nr:glucose 1-dehydrogenase [Syntrophaceae bacterium]